MTESVVADFTTDVMPDTAETSGPATGRVVMSDKRVVIATKDLRRSIPIERIFDLAHGSAPSELRRFFETTVSLAYECDGERRVALIEGADETVNRFIDLLFKAILNGSDVIVTHPARIGGRVTDSENRPMTIHLRPRSVLFTGSEAFSIDISVVNQFERVERKIRGSTKPVLSVQHMPDSRTLTTEIFLESNRKMNVLGRFLRLEYSKIQEELSDIEIGDQEVEALVGLYSGGDDASLAGILGIESNRTTMIINSLLEKGLIEEDEEGISLSPLGKSAVSDRIEQVNF